MKVTITKDIESGTAVEIHCREVTSETERLERYISRFDERLQATSEGNTYNVQIDEILYIESVDKKTFLYTTGHVLQTEKRLYELGELLDEKAFFRASKSVIVNLNKITKLKPCERRYDTVFTFHNGADSYYSVRGFRGYILV